MSIEAGVVLDRHENPIHWHTPLHRSAGFLPDSVDLWEVLWRNRERLGGFAHSHPGTGIPGPSGTDITTFAAVEAGLGVRLHWCILSADSSILVRWVGPHPHHYECSTLGVFTGRTREWMDKLRALSGYGP